LAISKTIQIIKRKNMDLLRFITAGSVDDGKSTLIGRLLYDSKSILVDQLEAIERASKNKEGDLIDLALLTDGLRAEREQGITIDVAYKYFSTPKRKFIIADAPGHIEYTRNMITGASNVELIIILVDARNGVVEQTRRHSIIAALLDIQNVVVAINKMDLLDYSEKVYNNIVNDYEAVVKKLALKNVTYLPISALKGDNIVSASDKLAWYKGKTLLEFIETVPLDNTSNLKITRFPVQYVIRPQSKDLHDYRGFAGKISSGIFKKGDKITVLPSGQRSTIKAIEIAGKEINEAFANQSIILHLEDNIGVSRGDLIVKDEHIPGVAQEQNVLLFWMDSKNMSEGNRYSLQINSDITPIVIKEIEYKIDVNTLEQISSNQAGLNEIVRAKIKTASPLAYDAYDSLKENGKFILIDLTSNVTVGAGLFL